MIRGEEVSGLVAVCSNLSYYNGKGFCSDLVVDDNLSASVEDFVEYCKKFAADPAFARWRGDIYEAMEDADRWKNELEFLKSLETPPPVTGKDRKQLREKLGDWSKLVTGMLFSATFSTLSETSIEKLFPADIAHGMGQDSKNDVLDGIKCLQFCLPTPAAMIFFRVAEAESRKYYRRIYNGKDPPKRWRELIDELRNDRKVDAPVLGYMDYLRDKRNDAEHPDRRYTQEEAEGILFHLSSITRELYLR